METNSERLGDLIKNGEKIITENGDMIILDYLISDAGGQGDVYHVTYRNKPYALKWYCKNKEDVIESSQYNTIKRLCNNDSPGPMYIWPQILVTEVDPKPGKKFGYLMEVMPAGYYEMKDYLRKDDDKKAIRFKSYNALLVAGMNIASAMQKLHLKGLSYKDLNPNNFAIAPDTGNVLVVDNDNVSFDGDRCSVKGMKGYMAPEIARSNYEVDPSTSTDKFSLAVILFQLFFIDHPMEGKRWEKYPVCSDKIEEYLYAINPIFMFDPDDDSNRPHGAYAPNALKRWVYIPLELRQLFIKVFTEGINDSGKRAPENAWITALSKAREKLIRFRTTRTSEREQFVNFDDSRSIPSRCLELRIGNSRVALYPGKAVYEISVDGSARSYNVPVAGILYNKQIDKLMIKNLSDKKWRGYLPESTGLIDIGPGKEFPIFPGVQIEFQHERPAIVGRVFDPKKQNL